MVSTTCVPLVLINSKKNMPDSIDILLDLYPLEELFEFLEIEPRLAIEILLEGGHIAIPEFLLNEIENDLD